jgi:hypothetical protein
MKTNITLIITSIISIILTTTAGAQIHGHINAGIADTDSNGADQDDPLAFYSEEIPDFESGGGFSVSMPFSETGRFAGYYNGSQTITVLSALTGLPEDDQHPALNSFIQLQLVSVTGPAGGEFGFWESTALGGGSTPTFSLAVGATNGTDMWALSEGDESGDPYGHIHGRRFSATLPGLYTVGFRLVDTSTVGTAGGPIHIPSRIYLIDFEAVPEPSSAALLAAGIATVLFTRNFRTLENPHADSSF